jgi:hypothetical protein
MHAAFVRHRLSGPPFFFLSQINIRTSYVLKQGLSGPPFFFQWIVTNKQIYIYYFNFLQLLPTLVGHPRIVRKLCCVSLINCNNQSSFYRSKTTVIGRNLKAMTFSLTQTLFTLLLLLLLISAIAQTANITMGDSLSAADNSSWLSPSGDFAFGFCQHINSDFFLLSIWYDKIPDRTIVWYANADQLAPRGSKVELMASRLVLTSPQGKELWASKNLTSVVGYGVMKDTGSFVIKDRNSNNLWETFQKPTDTILPT